MDRPERPGRVDAIGARVETVPRAGGGVRRITWLDPAGEAAYRRAVRPLAGRIEGALGPEVLAIRTLPDARGPWVAPWGPARRAWRRSLEGAAADRKSTFAVADVRDCYASITPETLVTLLGQDAEPAARFLRRLRELGVRGLPVGPEPSAALANAVLARLDAALRGAGVRHRRWVDDFFWWGSPDDVVRAMSALDRTSRQLGLRLHDDKTRILTNREEVRSLALRTRDSSIIGAP